MTDPDHDVLAVVIDAEVAAAAEFVFEAHEAVARHEEVARILEQVEADEVAVEQRGEQLVAVLEHAEDATRGEGRVEEETDVRLARKGRFPQVARDHQQIVSVDPYLLELRELFLPNGLIKFVDSLSESLIDLSVVSP